MSSLPYELVIITLCVCHYYPRSLLLLSYELVVITLCVCHYYPRSLLLLPYELVIITLVYLSLLRPTLVIITMCIYPVNLSSLPTFATLVSWLPCVCSKPTGGHSETVLL